MPDKKNLEKEDQPLKPESNEELDALKGTFETFQQNISDDRQRAAYKTWQENPAKAREQFPDMGLLFDYFDELRAKGEM